MKNKLLFIILIVFQPICVAGEFDSGLIFFDKGDYQQAFRHWNTAVGLYGKQAECQIAELANTKTARGRLISGLIWYHGYCQASMEPVIAAQHFRIAGEMFIKAGDKITAQYCLNYLLGMPSDPLIQQHARALHRQIKQ